MELHHRLYDPETGFEGRPNSLGPNCRASKIGLTKELLEETLLFPGGRAFPVIFSLSNSTLILVQIGVIVSLFVLHISG